MAKKTAKKPTTTSRTRAEKPAEKPASKPRVAARSVSNRSGFSKYLELGKFRSLSVGAIIAELIGTFAFVLVYMTVQGSQLYLFFAYAALVLVLARAAGPHLNPAITVGLWAVRRLSGLRAISLIIAQVLGAMLALVVANALVPDTVNQLTGQSEAGQVFAAAELPEASDELWRLLTIEAIGSLILSIGAAAAFLTNRGLAAKAFTLGGAYLVGLLIVQGGQILNPAMAIGLQAVQMEVWPLAIYVLTPLVASVIGMSLYRFMRSEGDGIDDSTPTENVVQRVKV